MQDFFCSWKYMWSKKKKKTPHTMWQTKLYNQNDPTSCSQFLTWYLYRVKHHSCCCSSNELLDDGSWAVVGDSFSETDVSKRINPARGEDSTLTMKWLIAKVFWMDVLVMKPVPCNRPAKWQVTWRWSSAKVVNLTSLLMVQWCFEFKC